MSHMSLNAHKLASLRPAPITLEPSQRPAWSTGCREAFANKRGGHDNSEAAGEQPYAAYSARLAKTVVLATASLPLRARARILFSLGPRSPHIAFRYRSQS